MNRDPYPYNPEWSERSVRKGWENIEMCGGPAKGRALKRDPYLIAKYHGADDITALELARLIREDWTGMKVMWVERMRDLDDWCATMPEEIPKYLKPEWLSHLIWDWQRAQDQFHPDTIRMKAFLDSVRAGGEFVYARLDTGEETHHITLPGSREGAAHEN